MATLSVNQMIRVVKDERTLRRCASPATLCVFYIEDTSKVQTYLLYMGLAYAPLTVFYSVTFVVIRRVVRAFSIEGVIDMIKVGDTIPSVDFMRFDGGLVPVGSLSYFSGVRVILVGVPGCFTPQCSVSHVPGYLALRDSFLEKGVDKIACTSVNDAFVCDAWAKALGALGTIDFLADGNLAFVNATGLTLDASALGMGTRSMRYAMLVENCVVKSLQIEPNPVAITTSGAEAMLASL